jgi:Flp pilus assembly protein protease CpaA
MILELICLIFLLAFSKQDIEKGEIENLSIFIFLVIGFFITYAYVNLTFSFISFLILGFLGYFLWEKRIIGGADAKILPCLGFYMGFKDVTSLFFGLEAFLIAFALVGLFYSYAWKVVTKKKKIPFVPAIALTYLAFVIIQWLL